MDREEIISTFRAENPEIPERVIKDTVLAVWCKQGNIEICAKTRCIVDQEGTTISTTEDDERWPLSSNIPNFFDIDEYPGGGVTYNAERIRFITLAQLDAESPSWRSRSSGTPKKYWRAGDYIYVDRPVDSEEDDIVVYSILKPDEFAADDATPYNELGYLEPFHYGINKYLEMRAMQKIGKEDDGKRAKADYDVYVAWMKKTLGGSKYAKTQIRPASYPSQHSA